MIDIKLFPDALKIYYEEYYGNNNSSFDSYKDFADKRSHAKIYGLFIRDVLIGCIYFIQKTHGHTFHLAVIPEYRGKWMHYYKKVLDFAKTFEGLHTAARNEDKHINRLLKSTGFEEINTSNGFTWYKL